jgi:hypothetical protein
MNNIEGMGASKAGGPSKIIPGDDDDGELYPGFSLDNILNGGTDGTGRNMGGRGNMGGGGGGGNMGGGGGYYGLEWNIGHKN